MSMQGRSFVSENYRYGYQGSEKDNETFTGAYTTEFRMLDVRLGRWFTPDPITHPWSSPYNSMDNNPIALTDPLGLSSGGGDKTISQSSSISGSISAYKAMAGDACPSFSGSPPLGSGSVFVYDASSIFAGNNTANQVNETFNNLTQALGNFATENTQVPYAAPRIESEIRINDDGGYAGVIKVTANGETAYIYAKGAFENNKANPDNTSVGALYYVQMSLDVVGVVPVVGPFADLANALISAGTGDYVAAAISLTAIVVDGAVMAKYATQSIESLPKVIKASTISDIPKEVINGEKKLVVIGENMEKRVIPFVKEITDAGGNAKYFKPRSEIEKNWMRNQQRWIKDVIDDPSIIIIDHGIDKFRKSRSPYYLEEQKYINKYVK